jgi:calcium/calmodulin-dependent protein kinase I
LVKLANRIEALKMQEDDEEDVPNEADIPANAMELTGEALAAHKSSKGLNVPQTEGNLAPSQSGSRKRSLSRLARGAIFREVVLAKVREMKEQEAQKQFEKSATEQVRK